MTLLYVLLFLCSSILPHASTTQSSCSFDSDCNYGICTPVGSSKYCSCLSGFGGSICSERPSSNCTYDTIGITSSTFQANASLEYQYPNLTIEIITNLEQTIFKNASTDDTKISKPPYSQQLTVVFGNGSFSECNFPNNQVDWKDLVATSGDCKDRIKLVIPWNDAKSRCGFSSSSNNGLYEQTIAVQRRYLLDSSTGVNITRVDSRTFQFRIIFPSEADVSTASVIVITPLPSTSPSITPSITPSISPGVLETFSTVVLRIEGTVENFDTQAFLQAMADILNIPVTRLVIVDVRSGSVVVQFQVYDTPESSSVDVADQLVEIVESGDPVLTEYGITVLNVTVDTSTAAPDHHSNDNSSDSSLEIVLLAVLVPAGFIFLVASVGLVLLLARRLKNGTGAQVAEETHPAASPTTTSATSPKAQKSIYGSEAIPSPRFRRAITKNLFEQPYTRDRQGSVASLPQANPNQTETETDSVTEIISDESEEDSSSVISASSDYF